MGSLAQLFGWSADPKSTEELPDIFPLGFRKDEFVRIDIVNIYQKILTDVLERTHGLSDDHIPLLWDNCLKSTKGDGLITMLARAMAEKKNLFLIYDPALAIVREADGTEQNQIRADYEKKAESELGIFISFTNYNRSDMVKLYSGLEWATLAALHKSMNLSKAIQLKLSDLRASTSLIDSTGAKQQATTIAKGLSEGRDILLDAKDEIVTATPDLSATKEAIQFLDSKRSFYLGLPAAYVTGEQTGGLGTTGENDTKAIERGLKAYYFAVVKPVLEDLFDVKLKYKSQDFRQITHALETLKTFELVSEEYISHEQKKKIVESLLDIDAVDNKTEAPKPEAPPIEVKPPAGAPVRIAPAKGDA